MAEPTKPTHGDRVRKKVEEKEAQKDYYEMMADKLAKARKEQERRMRPPDLKEKPLYKGPIRTADSPPTAAEKPIYRDDGPQTMQPMQPAAPKKK